MKRKWVVQLVFLAAVLALWQIVYERGIFPKLMFPSLPMIGSALIKGFTQNELGKMAAYSMGLLLRGFGIGILLAFLFSGLSFVSKIFRDIYQLLVSMCDLIPGVALLPLAILWLGIGEQTIIVIVVHSILWPMSRSIMDGFSSIPVIYREVGQNIGLGRFGMLAGVYVPASFANVLSGIRVGWARAWRGLISAEMIFGTTSSGAGIGWYIFMRRTNVDIAGVFAALLVIIAIGVLVEYVVFRLIEKHTIRKWGVSR